MKLLPKFIRLPFGKTYRRFASLSLKKKIFFIGVALILFIVAAGQIASLTRPSPFTTQKVIRGNITEYVTEAGNIIASGKTDIYSPTDGIVTETYVANGDSVDEGDPLFAVKSTATDQEAQAAYANYLAAASTLNAAQSTANTLRADMYAKWDSFRNLATNSTYENGDDTPNRENRLAAEFQIAQDQWLAAEKKYKDQQTAIAQGQAQVASTWALYQATQDAVVKAPIGGIVSNLSINNGSSVAVQSVSLITTTSTPALVLSDNVQSEAVVRLSESDVAKVHRGQRAVISMSAVDNKEYTGTVSRVDTIGTDTQGVITYNAYITLLDADNNIRPGMTIDAEIVTKEIKNVLSVPNSAVKPYQGGRAVRVPDPKAKDKFIYIPVQIGARGNEKTEIKRGLKEGQVIVTTIANENIKRPGPFGN